jgi:hypothetical protein
VLRVVEREFAERTQVTANPGGRMVVERTFWLHLHGCPEHGLENDTLPGRRKNEQRGSGQNRIRCGGGTHDVLPNHELLGEIVQDAIR